MRLVEEVYVKAKEDLICQSCGTDIPKDSNHLLESYVHHGVISTSHYCLNPKCNPPNNVRLKLFWGTVTIGNQIAVFLPTLCQRRPISV